MTKDELSATTRSILDQAISDLRGTELSRPSQFVAKIVLKVLGQRRGDMDVIAAVRRLERELQLVGNVLARCRERLWEAEELEAASDPDGDTGWRHRIRKVSSAFEAGEHEPLEWVGLWLEALERRAWDWCQEVTSLPSVPRGFAVLRSDLEAVTHALRTKSDADAVGPSKRLLDSGLLGPEAAAKIGLLATRILLGEGAEHSEVSAQAEHTVELVGDERWQWLARTAVAEAAFAYDGAGAARHVLSGVLATAEPPVDALILMGRVEESEQQWSAADRLYEQAIDADDRVDTSALLREVPARLLVRYAARKGLPAKRAALLLKRALQLGVPGDGDYPDKDMWASLGDRLVQWSLAATHDDPDSTTRLKREAASAYAQAGDRFSSSGYFPRAVELMRHACALASDDAELRWQYAETLWLDGSRTDGVINRERMEAARVQLNAGLSLRSPGASEAWVLLLKARLDEDLEDPSEDPALTLERAILLEPNNEVAHACLANTLRRRGYIQEALEASVEGMSGAFSVNDFVFSTRMTLTLDVADYDAALTLLDERGLAAHAEQTLAFGRAEVALRQGRPETAQSLLARAGDNELARLLHALSTHAVGQRDAARDEFSALWTDTRSGPTYEMAGWAAFGAGLLDEAVGLYRPLAAQAPDFMPYRRDLGQFLLVRGDVDEGSELLHEGIDRCPHPDELVFLLKVELPYVRAKVESTPHEPAVHEALVAVERHIEDRVATLRSRRRVPGAGPEGAAVKAAAARTAAHEGRALAALDLYAALAASGVLPEAQLGVVRAGYAAAKAADEAVHVGEPERAIKEWEVLSDRLTGLAVAEAEPLLLSVRCRLALSELLHGAADWHEQLVDQEKEGLTAAMAEARDVLASTPERLWRLRDAMRRLTSEPGGSGETLEMVTGLVAGLPVARTYGLLAERDGAADSVLQATSTRLEIRLGPDAAAVVSVADVDDRVALLRDEVEQTTGVRIPWVYSHNRSDLAATAVEYRVHGRWVAQVDLAGIDPSGWLDTVDDGIDRVVHDHLGRLIGIDDVGLWLEGWDLNERDAPSWSSTDPSSDRLRLARLLRMLVREGASVADRDAVVSGLTSSASREGTGAAGTLDTLREVRLRLGLRALGVMPGSRPVELPAGIESRFVDGLSPDLAELELDRAAARRLATDLRKWLESQPPASSVIVVEHPGIRPFVWRMLPPGLRPLHVVTKEELT